MEMLRDEAAGAIEKVEKQLNELPHVSSNDSQHEAQVSTSPERISGPSH